MRLRTYDTEVQPKDLPALPFQAHGAWIPLLIEPRKVQSTLIEVVQRYDLPYEMGVGWVLGAAQDYTYVPPSKEEKTAKSNEDMTWVHPMPVKRGDRVMFRRFLRSQASHQPPVFPTMDLDPRFEKWETLFIHVQDVMGVLEVEDVNEEDGPSADRQ